MKANINSVNWKRMTTLLSTTPTTTDISSEKLSPATRLQMVVGLKEMI